MSEKKTVNWICEGIYQKMRRFVMLVLAFRNLGGVISGPKMLGFVRCAFLLNSFLFFIFVRDQQFSTNVCLVIANIANVGSCM